MNILVTLRSGRNATITDVAGPFTDFVDKNARSTPQGFMVFLSTKPGVKPVAFKYKEIESIQEVD